MWQDIGPGEPTARHPGRSSASTPRWSGKPTDQWLNGTLEQRTGGGRPIRRSEEDDAVTAWIGAGRESLEHGPGVKRELRPQGCEVLAHDVSIGVRRGQQQDDPIHMAVTAFQGQSTLECLQVDNPRFRLDADADPAAQYEVPGTRIGWSDRNFAAPRPSRAHTRLETCQEAEMRGVAERGTVGIDTNAEPMTEAREDDRGSPYVEPLGAGVLDSLDVRARDAGRRRKSRLADSRRSAQRPNIARQLRDEPVALVTADGADAERCWHVDILTRGDCVGLIGS